MTKPNSVLPLQTYPPGVLMAGCVVVAMGWLLLPTSGVVATVGVLFSLLLGLTVAISLRATATSGTFHLETPFLLAQVTEMFQQYQAVSESLLKASRNPDPFYREIAPEQIDELTRKAAAIAEESFLFEETETWRIVYERLLQSPGLHLYRSVA